MRSSSAAIIIFAGFCASAFGQNSPGSTPRWWSKYQYLSTHKANPASGPTTSAAVAGANVNVSNECGPQSETYVAINPANPSQLAGGSNEIFRLPMRGYASGDGGQTWQGTDLPLPPPIGNGIDFGSDPSLAFDTQGSVFYSYIVVFFGNGNGVNGTELAVARSTDGGKTYPAASFFSFSSGSNHFNDKPMITADTNQNSPYRDRVYVAWDAASGGSTSGGVRLAYSSDHGATFTVVRVDDPSGQGRAIGAVPFVAPNGDVFVAWNDYRVNAILTSRSTDGGATWGPAVVVSNKSIAFQSNVPAEFSRGALVYPACDADRSAGPNRGSLHCSWLDRNPDGVTTTIFYSRSADNGNTWTAAARAPEPIANVDRFNQWLAVDAANGDVNLSFYDTRNDTTGSRYQADIYFTSLVGGNGSWTPNLRVSSVSSNEHDCNGLFPCAFINYGNQYGDYAGLASLGGVSYPFWTDSRRSGQSASCSAGGTAPAMEEVFTSKVTRQ